MTITQQALAALQPPPGAPSSAWATRISACWQASVKAILEVGRLLAEAKEALPHGSFGRMIETDLPFTGRTAQMLMAIAADPRLTNTKHISHLPASWGTLYELTKLDDQKFDEKIADGTIKPDMMRRDIAAPEPTSETAPAEQPKTPLPNGARAIMGSRQEPDDSLDYFPTPPWATRALMEVVWPIAVPSGHRYSAWEPACGEGHIAEVLKEYFDLVIATDIHDYGYGQAPVDFLAETPPNMRPEWIITNPPFGDAAEAFVLKAIERAEIGCAMFLRLQWLESNGRYERIFSKYPPSLIAQFCERVPLHKGRYEPEGTTATAYLWIVWMPMRQEARGLTEFFWIPPGQRKALAQSDDAIRFTAHPVIKRASTFADDGSPTDQVTGEIIGEAGE